MRAAFGSGRRRSRSHARAFRDVRADRAGQVPPKPRPALASQNLRTRRAALLAMDQMSGGGLQPETVAALVTSPTIAVIDVAASGFSRACGLGVRPLVPWIERTGGWCVAGQRGTLRGSIRSMLDGMRRRFRISGRAVRGRRRHRAETPRILQDHGAHRAEEVTGRWVQPVARMHRHGRRFRVAVGGRRGSSLLPSTNKRIRLPELRDALIAAAANEKLTVGVRLDALAAVPGGHRRRPAGDI